MPLGLDTRAQTDIECKTIGSKKGLNRGLNRDKQTDMQDEDNGSQKVLYSYGQIAKCERRIQRKQLNINGNDLLCTK